MGNVPNVPNTTLQGAYDGFEEKNNKKKKKRSKSKKTEELERLIQETKTKLQQMKIEGIMAKDAQEEELYAHQMTLYDNRKQLMKQAKHCQDVVSFGEYIEIMQTTYTNQESNTTPVPTIIPDDGSTTRSNKSNNTTATTSTSTDIMVPPQHFMLTYTIFAWFEAYLLKRLHMAMLQQKQEGIHSKSWSGVVADLYFEIPKVKKHFEQTLGGLFVRKQHVEVEKSQKQYAYAEHVRLQASTILKLEKASWEQNGGGGPPPSSVVDNKLSNNSKRKSLPTMISIGEEGEVATRNNSANSATISMTTVELSNSPSERGSSSSGTGTGTGTGFPGRNSGMSMISAYTEISDGASELGREMSKIKESPPHHHRYYKNNIRSSGSNTNSNGRIISRTSSPLLDQGFESDITESSDEEEDEDEEDSMYLNDDDDDNDDDNDEEDEDDEEEDSSLDQPSGLIAVQEHNKFNPTGPEFNSISAMTVPKGLHRQVSDQTPAEREQARIQAKVENSRLERERLLRKTRELQTLNSFDSTQFLDEIEKAESGESRLSKEEVERLKRLDEQRKAKEKQRSDRAAFKAQRLRDLQTRLQRTSGHSTASRSITDTLPLISGASTGTGNGRDSPISALGKQLPEKQTEDAEKTIAGTTVTAALTERESIVTSKSKSKKKQKNKSKNKGLTEDDRSTGSKPSLGSQKSAKRKSALLAAEKRAQEKMAQLSQIMASEELESYVQEKEDAEKAAAGAFAIDNEHQLLKSPGGSISSRSSISSRASRQSRRSLRLKQTIRKSEEKATMKLKELTQLNDDMDGGK